LIGRASACNGFQEAIDQIVVEIAAVQQTFERRPLQPYGIDDALALGSAGQPVELGQEIAEDANGLMLPVMGQERAGQALEICNPIPVRGGRRRRRPLRPVRVDRLARPLLTPRLV
jgi:hypothetical protein